MELYGYTDGHHGRLRILLFFVQSRGKYTKDYSGEISQDINLS